MSLINLVKTRKLKQLQKSTPQSGDLGTGPPCQAVGNVNGTMAHAKCFCALRKRGVNAKCCSKGKDGFPELQSLLLKEMPNLNPLQPASQAGFREPRRPPESKTDRADHKCARPDSTTATLQGDCSVHRLTANAEESPACVLYSPHPSPNVFHPNITPGQVVFAAPATEHLLQPLDPEARERRRDRLTDSGEIPMRSSLGGGGEGSCWQHFRPCSNLFIG